MEQVTHADAASAALIAMLELVATTTDQGWVDGDDAVRAAVLGSPLLGNLNRITCVRTDAPVSSLAPLVARVSAEDLPYMVETRPGAMEAEGWCRAQGLQPEPGVPLMTAVAADVRASTAVPEVHWRRLVAAEMTEHVDVAAAGFGMPRDSLSVFDRSALCDDDRGAVLMAEVGGVPAATGLSVVVDAWVGVFVIATISAYRRRGLGAALTAQLVQDAVTRNGVEHALLQSSAMGLGVYEAIGFRTVEHWTRWTPTAA